MKIFIDPGHGGSDTGAVGIKGTKESDIVLKVGLALKSILENMGITVEMTRNTDEKVTLASRTEAANKAGADLYISIHCNGSAASGAHGTEVYSYPGNTNGEILAKKVLEHICNDIGTTSRGAKQENFAVLRLSDMPAILVESAFITNADEEKMMLETGFNIKMANAIAKGISSYTGISMPGVGEHWGEPYLKSLIKKGYISDEAAWSNFDGCPTIAMLLALADKIAKE
ncbi:MAG: N-acetylmuramoyl-L-alanine amidase [Bacillota bacterium]|nr:N-acetylmuramoyl-L-alanine amidase [Bacillota bacterium]